MNITTNHTTRCDRCGRPCDQYLMIMDKKICGICQWEQMQIFPPKEPQINIQPTIIEVPITPEPSRQVSREEMIERAWKFLKKRNALTEKDRFDTHPLCENLAEFAIEQKGGSE